MNNKIYATIKLILLKYPKFGQRSNFADLFGYSKQFGHGRQFKDFVRVCRNMGVYSKVVKINGKPVRTLSYNPAIDKYLSGEIQQLVKCDKCSGSGVMSAPVGIE